MVTLWQLLILLCFVISVGSALAPARLVGGGFRSYALALGIGVGVGAFFSWTMLLTHKAVDEHLKQRTDMSVSASEWYTRAFYLLKIVWIGFAVFLGQRLSSSLLW